MWNPGFPYLERRPATLHGYHRAFCVYSHHYRGTPECPGLVLGLDQGGQCRGVAFRVAPEEWDGVVRYLDERELIGYAYTPVQVPIVFFYPGRRAGQYGLHFLEFYPEDPGYRSTLIGGLE